jgi:DNA (cytosine-5)-methyltransferase 1
MKCYAIEDHPNDSRVTIDPNGIVQTLSSRMGTGGNNTPFVLITSTKADSQNGNCTTSQVCVPTAEAAGTEAKDLFVMNSSDDGIAAPLDASYYKGCGLRQGIEREYVMIKFHATGNGQLANSVVDDKTFGTLDCMHDQKIVIVEDDIMENDRKYVLRRLTPTECARLQGFPDWWCDGANGSDSAMYKLWGNGVALPCVAFIMGNIAEDMKKDKAD